MISRGDIFVSNVHSFKVAIIKKNIFVKTMLLQDFAETVSISFVQKEK